MTEDNDVLKAIRNRRSIRKFKDIPIPLDDLNIIIEAGRLAPNSWGRQDFGFVLIRDEKILADLADLTAKYIEGDYSRHKFFNAGQIVLITDERSKIPVCYADAGCAAENMFLAAESLGIASVWSNQFSTLRDKEDLIEYLEKIGIARNRLITCVCIFGYSDEEPKERKLTSEVLYL